MAQETNLPPNTTEELKLGEFGEESSGGGNVTGEASILSAYAEPEYKPKSSAELEAVYDIPVQVSAILGKTNMQVNHLLKLGRGTVIELDRKVGESIDIYVNNRLVARGEVVVSEERLGITMTEIIKTER